MIIGVPKEIKENECRVAITPAGVQEFISQSHQVFIESSAGKESGFSDEDFRQAGANVVPDAGEVWEKAELILKVKEPLPGEYKFLREGLIVFTFLHLAPARELTQALMEHHIIAIAYETVQLENGLLSLLIPMSQIAGRMAPQVGAYFLQRTHGGRGVLPGGIPGVHPAKIMILGAGTVGSNAAWTAIGLGAQVTVVNRGLSRLRYFEDISSGRVVTLVSNTYNIERTILEADLVITAVLNPGARAPFLITEEMVKKMKPGSVIVDVSVDQGGCVETSRITTHSDPVFIKHGVVHYGVANMPGAVPHTSTWALTQVTLPYALGIANKGYRRAIKEDSSLAKGVNIIEGKITCQAVAEAHDLEYIPLASILD
jgi:alanine dehydrogenase